MATPYLTDYFAPFPSAGLVGNSPSVPSLGPTIDPGKSVMFQSGSLPEHLSSFGMGTDLSMGSAYQPSMFENFGTFMKSAIGTKDNPGWGNLALGTVAGLANMYMGMKQYGLAKSSLDENKRQFNMNYDAQKNLTNSQLADRQAGRLAASPGMHESVADYMAKYGVR